MIGTFQIEDAHEFLRAVADYNAAVAKDDLSGAEYLRICKVVYDFRASVEATASQVLWD